MKFIVAEVERRIDWLEGLEVNVDLPFFAFCGDDFTAVDNQPIGRDLVIKLKPLLGRGNCRQDRESVDTRFDVGSSSLQTVRYSFNKLRREGEGGGGETYILFSQHLRRSGHLVLRGWRGSWLADGQFRAVKD